MPDASFHVFAQTAERIAATTKRTVKTEAAAAYFADLSDDDLRRAARYLAGRLFPLYDQRTVSVGYAALLNATAAATATDRDALQARLVVLGDPGEVAEEAVAAVAPSEVTLAEFGAWTAELATTRGTKRRGERLAAMLGRLPAVEAKYVVKLLANDLRIGFKEGGVEAAIAQMAGVSLKQVRRANMLTGDLGEVAVLARHGRLDTARMQLFHPIKFMLATAAEDDADVVRQMPDRFFIEDKFDGIRAQAHVGPDPARDGLHGVVHNGRRVVLFSRTLDAITPSFPDLVAPLARLAQTIPNGLLLDGEIVPVQGAAIRPFQALQRRLGRKKVPQTLINEVPVAFVAFDILAVGGESLLDTPFEERREQLEALPTDGTVRVSAARLLDGPEELDAAFEAARERGNEGLMVKAPHATYRPGRRGRDWLKVKRALATLDVVVTSVEVGSGKRRHLLSDFTFAVRASEADDTLLNVGKAYSGLTDAELATLTDWFKAHTLQSFAHGRVRLVEPQVVVEVAFDRVQPSKRHKSGYALRFPRIVRLRDDKPPSEIDTLEAVKALADEPVDA